MRSNQVAHGNRAFVLFLAQFVLTFGAAEAAAEETVKRVETEQTQATSSTRNNGAVTIERFATHTNSIGMELVAIPAGEFVMGSAESEEQRYADEQPHRVRITQPFYLGKYEVTQAEYLAVMGNKPSFFVKGQANFKLQDTSRFPVESVSWNDAVEFCRRLTAKEARIYRLPTEAEWEYACRAGSTTPFHWGAIANGREANLAGESPFGTATKGTFLNRTTQVGSYPSNAWGLFDMHGNVQEWCSDWYDKGYYATSPNVDPTGPAMGSTRVIRGGGWFYPPRLGRAANRHQDAPKSRLSDIGFRVVLLPEGAR